MTSLDFRASATQRRLDEDVQQTDAAEAEEAHAIGGAGRYWRKSDRIECRGGRGRPSNLTVIMAEMLKRSASDKRRPISRPIMGGAMRWV